VTLTPTIPASSLHTEKWISHFTLLFGLFAAVPVALFRGLPWGAGIFIGAILAWLNFRWLKQGLDALTAASTAQADHPKPQVPLTTYFTAAFRYGLIGLAVYVIFRYLNVPVLSMIVGLCALGAATMAVSVYEILRPQE
jgi:small-conductance mechanosensitive channel